MISEMTKVQIGVAVSQREELMKWLQEKEVLHLTPLVTKDQEAGTSNYEHRLAQLQLGLEFIERIKAETHVIEKKSWKNMFAGKPMATLEQLVKNMESLELDDLLVEIRNLSDELAEFTARKQELSGELKTLWPWREMDITGQDLKGTTWAKYALFTVSTREEILVKKMLQEIPTVVARDIRRDADKKRGMVYVELIYHREHEQKVAATMAKTNADMVSLDIPPEVTINKQIRLLTEEIENIDKSYKAKLKSASRFIKLEDKLRMAYDAILHDQERFTAERQAALLPWSVVIGGWVPKRMLAAIEASLSKDFPASCIEEVDFNKDEVPPVAFKNSALVEPFEAVTDIYGKPRYSELDPTPALSLFFLVAFGLALTDAGYGIIMMLVMWAAEKFFRLKKGMKKMVRLLYYGGLSTAIFGALTGGWFGISLEKLPASTIKDVLLSVKLIDPIQQPMTLLLVAFAVGIIQLLFAWMIKGYDDWRKKDFAAVAFDDAAWITMIVTILLWTASTRGILWAPYSELLKWLVLGNAGVLILTQGRQHKNPILKVGAGILSLYGLLNFLSDVLSYSRLLALGLATGIIALVVNLLGSMVVDSIPGVGWLLAIVVLLVGHTFNLGINTLGAFIHSGRLQFVEFFPKFMEGGGVPYKPFGRVSRYVDNPNDFK